MLELLAITLLAAAPVVTPLPIAPLPAAQEAPEEENEAAEENEAVEGTIAKRSPPTAYSFSQGDPIRLGSGLTTVSVEGGHWAPRVGFLPLRVSIDNAMGPRQRMALSFVPEGRAGGEVTKTIDLAAGEHRDVSLLLPSLFRYGRLQVRAPGVTEKDDRLVTSGVVGAGQWLVMSLGAAEDFERSVGKASPKAEDLRVMAIPREDAPTELAGYVGFDAVALPSAPLDALSEGARRALEAYAATGGTVLAPNAGRALGQHFPLQAVEEGHLADYGMGRVLLCAQCGKLALADVVNGAARQVAVVPLSDASARWRRHQSDDGPEVDALLPQARAPIGAFFAIISLFTLLIGPGSVWVARRRGPAALLVTIPGIAFVTCGVIVGSSLLKDGFSLHASARGYTELDPRQHRAVTAGVVAYYANLAPKAARFDTLTAVLGSPGASSEGYGAAMDWTDGVAAGSDFLPSRTYREWAFLAVEPTRARVVVKPGARGLVVQNALGAKVKSLTLASGEGLFEVRDLADGAEAVAQRASRAPSIADPSADQRLGESARRRRDRPLARGEFLAEVEGLGFLPDGGLRLRHDKSSHVVRGVFE